MRAGTGIPSAEITGRHSINIKLMHEPLSSLSFSFFNIEMTNIGPLSALNDILI